MARVPTWTELRMDATKLSQLQKECYRSVHDMLDRTIPEIDRKLALLNGESYLKNPTNLLESTPLKQATLRPTSTEPNLIEADTLETHVFEQNPIEVQPIKSARCVQTKEIKTTKPKVNWIDTPKVFDKRIKPNLEELEHLRPLPMPLNHYLRINRPDMIMASERRVMDWKEKAKKRRHTTSSRTFNRFEMTRSSSGASSNRYGSSLRSSLRSLPRSVSGDSFAPNYQVRNKLSQGEMKRLTARVYNRLPEVKRQRNDEVTKHMKVQNYKNKLEYGRMLLMNRRQGVINYPLIV